jgi:hypothetical protein
MRVDAGQRQVILAFTRPEAAVGFSARNESALRALRERAADKVAAEALAAHPGLAAAAEVKTRLDAEQAACWFCQKDVPADGTPHGVVLHKGSADARQERTIWVPRCVACQEIHRRTAPALKVLLPMVALALLGACVGIGLAANATLHVWGWVIGAAVAIAGTFGAYEVVRRATMARIRRAGSRPTAVANAEYPAIKRLLRDSWRIDYAKTSKLES